jgi:hypothetical protein
MEVAGIASWGLANTVKIFGLEKKQSKSHYDDIC